VLKEKILQGRLFNSTPQPAVFERSEMFFPKTCFAAAIIRLHKLGLHGKNVPTPSDERVTRKSYVRGCRRSFTRISAP
jgi:hypothetical protein